MSGAAQERLKVVLVDTRNPLNIGAAARAMSNFGFFDLRLVKPYEESFREAVSAVGAARLMQTARVYETVGEAVADCALVVGATGIGNRQIEHALHRLERGGRLMRRHLRRENVALLFGSEKYGLSNEDLSFCHWLVHIPTRPEHDSMNLGQAVAVCLYELARAGETARVLPEAPELAPGEVVERLSGLIGEALELSGYTDYLRRRSGEEKLRQMVRRLAIRAKDGDVWTGMVRQVLWKLKHPAG